MLRSLRVSTLSALVLAWGALMGASSAQVSFTANRFDSTKALKILAHGDFNNDGREDYIVGASSTDLKSGEVEIYLSNGDGSYNSPIAVPGSPSAIGDFNRDGKLDFATGITSVQNSANSEIEIFLGNGDGTFQSPKIVPLTSGGLDGLAPADMNHDGKTDLVIHFSGAQSNSLQVLTNNGDGTFTAGQRTSPVQQLSGAFIAGDFDGDGKADIAITFGRQGATQVQVWYGDGAGHLVAHTQIFRPGPEEVNFDQADAVDVNNDGRSDLIGTEFNFGISGTSTGLKQLAVFYGNSNRTLTYATIPTGNCTAGAVTVADFDGDGINDVQFGEGNCNQSGATTDIVVKPGTGSGNFGPEQTIYSSAFQIGFDSIAVRAARNTKPDIALTEALGAQTSPNTVPPSALTVLVNQSFGVFSECSAPNAATGISVCLPGSSSQSPVQFSIGSAGPVDMRKVEVWADGHKIAEQQKHAYSHYSFLDTSVPLATGTHKITIFANGWDNWPESKVFTLSVMPSCSAPSSPGVHICSPVNGSTVSSPVTAQATGKITGVLKDMELWVDGTKRLTEFSSTTITDILTLPPGTHRFAFLIINTAGQKFESVSNATVK